jgi:hypothetical protein
VRACAASCVTPHLLLVYCSDEVRSACILSAEGNTMSKSRAPELPTKIPTEIKVSTNLAAKAEKARSALPSQQVISVSAARKPAPKKPINRPATAKKPGR